jgi:hypothetical protein
LAVTRVVLRQGLVNGKSFAHDMKGPEVIVDGVA